MNLDFAKNWPFSEETRIRRIRIQIEWDARDAKEPFQRRLGTTKDVFQTLLHILQEANNKDHTLGGSPSKVSVTDQRFQWHGTKLVQEESPKTVASMKQNIRLCVQKTRKSMIPARKSSTRSSRRSRRMRRD